MVTNTKVVTAPVSEALIEDASNIFWQSAERSRTAPPAAIIDALIAPASLRHAYGQAGALLTSMGQALVTYVRGDREDAIQTASQTKHAIRKMVEHIWEEDDEHGLPRQCYAMPDGTTLARCGVSGEWAQIRSK